MTDHPEPHGFRLGREWMLAQARERAEREQTSGNWYVSEVERMLDEHWRKAAVKAQEETR